ncbi:serine hydrolase domain-containing protein [Paenibacillus donghaensis]|uniref:Serine hydrolase n=1 Tax=Paenibacillus donghaensis TaxID=414771 RepID=A0A2Z2KEQ0_9BACL|nr:serine hydrolase domain-containing protein [Paenibacillus donghaensis]ASA22395.1 serine hydrolase [Paenibacillus donghaensis]
MKKIFSVLLASSIMLTSSIAFAKEPNRPLQKKADEIANTLVTQYGETSVQYALMDNGEIILSGSKGVYAKDSDRPITKDTMYGIGSVSKMYAAAAVMMWVDRGKLNLDEPFVTYVADFKMADERYKQITPRMLLNHSSGINGTSYGNTFLFDDVNPDLQEDVLASLRTQTLKANPGEFSVYTNDGFTLLEILVARLSGMSYSEFIEKNISEPLGLQHTKTPMDEFDRTALARTYLPNFEGALPTDAISAVGTGGIYSTAEDMTKMAEVLMGKTDLLSEKSAKAMLNEEYKNGLWPSDGDQNFFAYGLGWDSVNLYPFGDYNIQAAFKGGDSVLYKAAMIVLPEYNISVAVASSGGSSVFNSMLGTGILKEYLKEKGIIKEIKPDKTFTPPVKVQMPESLNQYNGVYAAAADSPKEIEIKDGEIDMPVLLGGYIPAQKYVYVGDDHFKSEDGTVTLSFEQQNNGITYIKASAYLNFPGLDQSSLTFYDSQKVEPVQLNKAVSDAWTERVGKDYLLLTERPSSEALFVPLVPSKLLIDVKNGYVAGSKILDENNAVNAVQIPVASGRDTTDLKFYKENNAEYLKMYNMTFINKADLPSMYEGKTSSTTIQANGFARWYQINDKAANKTITVNLPTNTSFAVYDENNTCVSFSTVSGKNTAKLPVNGYVGFFGKASDVFLITLK